MAPPSVKCRRANLTGCYSHSEKLKGSTGFRKPLVNDAGLRQRQSREQLLTQQAIAGRTDGTKMDESHLEPWCWKKMSRWSRHRRHSSNLRHPDLSTFSRSNRFHLFSPTSTLKIRRA